MLEYRRFLIVKWRSKCVWGCIWSCHPGAFNKFVLLSRSYLLGGFWRCCHRQLNLHLPSSRLTPAKYSKVYLEKLGHILFQDRQSMQRDLCHAPKISRRFASKWRIDDLVRGATNRTKTALAILQFLFHYFSAFLFEAFGVYFSWQTKEWYPSVVHTLLAIFFLEYWNNHTCSPISGSFAKLPRSWTRLESN